MKELVADLIPRLMAETPSYHRKLRNLALILESIIVILLGAASEEMITLPENIINYFKIAAYILPIVAGQAQLAKKSINEQTEEDTAV